MEATLSVIAILLSLISLSFLEIRKASKQSAAKLGKKMSRPEEDINNIQNELHSLAVRLESTAAALLAQAASASNEISTLKTEVGRIRCDLQANSQKLLIHAQILESIKEKQSASEAEKDTPLETFRQELRPFGEPDSSAQGITPLPPLGSVAWLGVDQPTQDQPVSDFSPIEEPSAHLAEPYEQVTRQYQEAINRGDRQALRQLQFKELNITSECEDSLLRRSSGQATKLEAVQGGGSYMVVSGEGRYWLFPTAQTLDGFSMNQPQKGIFDYECEILSKPVVKKPAEVNEESGDWIIIAQGVISVPG